LKGAESGEVQEGSNCTDIVSFGWQSGRVVRYRTREVITGLTTEGGTVERTARTLPTKPEASEDKYSFLRGRIN